MRSQSVRMRRSWICGSCWIVSWELDPRAKCSPPVAGLPFRLQKRRLTLAGQVREARTDKNCNPVAGLGMTEVVKSPGEGPRRQLSNPIVSACYSSNRPFQAVRSPWAALLLSLLFSLILTANRSGDDSQLNSKLGSAMAEVLLRVSPSR